MEERKEYHKEDGDHDAPHGQGKELGGQIRPARLVQLVALVVHGHDIDQEATSSIDIGDGDDLDQDDEDGHKGNGQALDAYQILESVGTDKIEHSQEGHAD